MGASATFQFARKYTLRPAGGEARDSGLAEKWIAADPYHRGRVQPDYWLEQGIGIDSYLCLDDEGPLFFYKMVLFEDSSSSRAIEIHIQFPPSPSVPKKYKQYRSRMAEGLIEGLAWLEKILRQAEVREMFFESTNPGLIAFAIRRLGFVLEGGKLRKRLPEKEATSVR